MAQCADHQATKSERNVPYHEKKEINTAQLWTAQLRGYILQIFYHYSFTHINDQNKWQSLRKEETEPTKGSLTAISTTDVFTEGCLLSAEQSHTWETPKSFRETSRKPTCKFVTAMSQTRGPTPVLFLSERKTRGEEKKKQEKTSRPNIHIRADDLKKAEGQN